MDEKYKSADLLMKLYELRREEKMREARNWFTTFFPESAAEIMQTILNPETSANFRIGRQLLGYGGEFRQSRRD
ncbi:MAG: hypothetical protein HC846_10965 [Blastocatellia bacterium]|nr:hypothetical protein [Blastocatellia bacterium]